MALDALPLQILHESVGEVVLRALVPGFLLALRSAVRTHKINYVLLRIAAQSCPSRSTNADHFANLLFHGCPPGSSFESWMRLLPRKMLQNPLFYSVFLLL